MKQKISKKERWNKIQDKILTKAGTLANQRHLGALRDGFALVVPLLIAASVGVIFMTFIFGGWETTSTSLLGWISWGIPGQVETTDEGIVKFIDGSVAQQISQMGFAVFNTVWKGIFDFLAIYATLTISYSLARIKGTKDTFIAPLISLGAFMILTYGDVSYFGSKGLMVAILTSILSVEIFTFFEKSKRLEIKMPAGVPPAVGRSFSKLFPTIFTLLIFIGFQAPFLIITSFTTGFGSGDWFSVAKAISVGIQAPFLEMASGDVGSFGIGMTYVFFSGLLWFIGLHGTNILDGVFVPIMIAGLEQNKKFIEEKIGSPTVLTQGTLYNFVFFGGTGVTLALIIVGLIFSKKRSEREIIKFGGPAGIFNINEPIIFGIPLVLNFTYFIPFMLSQMTLFVTTWLSIQVFQIVKPGIIAAPWTSPAIIGGFLVTAHWTGIVLAAFNLIIACLIWMPFVLISNHQAKKRGEELVKIDYRAGANKIKMFFKKKKNKIE